MEFREGGRGRDTGLHTAQLCEPNVSLHLLLQQPVQAGATPYSLLSAPGCLGVALLDARGTPPPALLDNSWTPRPVPSGRGP